MRMAMRMEGNGPQLFRYHWRSLMSHRCHPDINELSLVVMMRTLASLHDDTGQSDSALEKRTFVIGVNSSDL